MLTRCKKGGGIFTTYTLNDANSHKIWEFRCLGLRYRNPWQP